MLLHTFEAEGKSVCLFPGRQPDAPVLYLNTFPGEGERVLRALRETGCADFSLVAVSNLDWNCDMAPWDAPPAFARSGPFTGGAQEYLGLLTQKIIPLAEGQLASAPRWRGIAGYSMAGLFAVYALCAADVFSRAASVSGSLWFPGMREYVLSHGRCRLPQRIYFSLGSRESKTRNPMLQRVAQNTQEIAAFYRGQGVDTLFELNPGSHFDHPDQRTARGIAWLLDGQDAARQVRCPPPAEGTSI